MGRFSIDADFKGTDKVTGTVGKISSRLDSFTRGASVSLRGVDRALGGVNKAMKTVGVATVAGAGIAGAALHDVIGVGAEFEKTLIGAAAKFAPEIRKGTPAFEELRKTAERVGATTEFNAQQAAMGLKDLASAGFTTKQAIAALPNIVNLATAAEVELATASNIATKSLGAFGLKTDDATQLAANLARTTDLLQATAGKTSTDLDRLFEAVKEGAPVATAAGGSMESILALAGQMSEAGIEASVAGTTLKNMFLNLAAPTKRAAGTLKKLGVETRDSKGNLLDAVGILADVEKGMLKMGTAQKTAALETIFGRESIAGLAGVLKLGTDKLVTLRSELGKAGGSTAQMASIMRDSTQGKLDDFSSAIDGVKIAIFGAVQAPFEQLTKRATDWASANQKIIATKFVDTVKEIRDNLPEIVTWTKRIAIGVGAFYAVSAAVKVAQVSVAAFELTMGAASLAGRAFTATSNLAAAATSRLAASTVASSAAAGVNTAAQWARNAAVTIGRIGTTSFTAATIANTAATWAKTGATTAYNAIVRVGTTAMAAYTAVTSGGTIASGAATVATWARTAAQGTLNAVTTFGTGALAAYRGATIAGTVATVAATGPMAAFALTVGAATAAIGALVLAYDQWNKLNAETEGLGITGIAKEMWDQGTWDPAKATDEFQNRQARARVGGGGAPNVVSPQERIAKTISETTVTEKSEIVIRDETGRGEVTKAPKGKGMNLKLQRSGAF